MSEALDLDAVRTRVERYRLDWVAERTALARLLAGGERLPDGYWQAEHRTRKLYDNALALHIRSKHPEFKAERVT